MSESTIRNRALDAIAELIVHEESLGCDTLADNEAWRSSYRRKAEPYLNALTEAGLRVVDNPAAIEGFACDHEPVGYVEAGEDGGTQCSVHTCADCVPDARRFVAMMTGGAVPSNLIPFGGVR